MYEGRTRGKKLKYTYSDDEDIFSDGLPSRRSGRNTSTTATPAEPTRTRYTASGRQIRSRAGGLYGEALLVGQREDSADDEEDHERPQRTRTTTHPNGYSGYNADDLEDEPEAQSSGSESGNEWQSGEGEENEAEDDEEDEHTNTSEDELLPNGERPSLMVRLRYRRGAARDKPNLAAEENGPVNGSELNGSENQVPPIVPHEQDSFGPNSNPSD